MPSQCFRGEKGGGGCGGALGRCGATQNRMYSITQRACTNVYNAAKFMLRSKLIMQGLYVGYHLITVFCFAMLNSGICGCSSIDYNFESICFVIKFNRVVYETQIRLFCKDYFLTVRLTPPHLKLNYETTIPHSYIYQIDYISGDIRSLH